MRFLGPNGSLLGTISAPPEHVYGTPPAAGKLSPRPSQASQVPHKLPSMNTYIFY